MIPSSFGYNFRIPGIRIPISDDTRIVQDVRSQVVLNLDTNLCSSVKLLSIHRLIRAKNGLS